MSIFNINKKEKDLVEETKIVLNLLKEEKESEEQKLYNIDKAFFQFALAILSIFTLTLSLMVTAKIDWDSITKIENFTRNFSYFLLIVSQVIYFSAFYCAMLNRTRNTCIGHIKYLNMRINDILENINVEYVIPFRYSFVSKFNSVTKKEMVISYAFVAIIFSLVYGGCICIVLFSHIDQIIKNLFVFVIFIEFINGFLIGKQWYSTKCRKTYNKIKVDVANYILENKRKNIK